MASAYLTKTFSSSGTSDKITTISFWCKRATTSTENSIITANATARDFIRFESSGAFKVYLSGGSANLQTSKLFRDTSAWYHIVVAFDTTQATSSNRIKIYVNGTQISSFSTSTYPAQNTTLKIGTANPNHIGNDSEQTTPYFDGLMTHFHLIDGTAYQASDFGETDSTSGIWKPKTAPSVTYGTNGFFLKFENSGAMGTDSSGNGNNFTVSGTLTQNVDSPSNNFATLNPLVTSSYSSLTLGNNTVKGNTAANDGETYSTLGTGNTGKWYWEIKATGLNGSGNPKLGFVQTNSDNIFRLQNGGSGYGGGSNSDSIMIRPDGKVIDDGSTSGVLYGTFSAGDILSFALDSDNGAFYYAINGTWQNSGDPTSGASKTGAVKTWTATSNKASHGQHVCIGTYDTATQADCNFGNGYFGTTQVASAGTAPSGGGIFEYDCPSGYQALCTKGINSF